ncbi:hypothetical protein B5F40_13210 [Gordonibacter sp. An230]|nr:hypothetical protein B5F40_13210 [Gordonibacter sp. An230]
MDPACGTFVRTAARGPALSPRAASGAPRPAPPGPTAAPTRFPHPAHAERAACAASEKPDGEAAGPKDAESLSTAEVEAAVSRWGDAVLRLARSRMGNAADAEDVLQAPTTSPSAATTSISRPAATSRPWRAIPKPSCWPRAARRASPFCA